jgi:hypothetical protein
MPDKPAYPREARLPPETYGTVAADLVRPRDHPHVVKSGRSAGPLRIVTATGTRLARLVARVAWNSSAASAVSAIFRVIGAASAVSARGRGYGKEKVYGSIP